MIKWLLSALVLGCFNFALAGEIICSGANVTNPNGWNGGKVFGKELGNGGNVDGLDFSKISTEVLKDISSQPSIFPEVNKDTLACVLYTTKIIVSVDPLFIDYHGVRQQVVAVNYTGPNRIIIHRSSWLDLSENQKKSIAFHELLGVMGLESTGDYKISSRYFAPNQVSLYQCVAWLVPSNFYQQFSMSETTKGTWIETPQNQQVMERFYIRTSPGALENWDGTTTKSVVLIVTRSKKGATDWEATQNMNFFGLPMLPSQFHLELDKDEPNHNDLILDCKGTPAQP